jgi:hypothetical protein
MPFMRRVRQLGSPAATSCMLEPQSSKNNHHHLTHKFRARSHHYVRQVRDATDNMTHHRISSVVIKPVCTPVPPAEHGSVAGHAGLAPPAITLPERAAYLPAASGTLTRLLWCTSPKQILRPQLMRLRVKAAASRRAAIRLKMIFVFRGAVPSQPPACGQRSRFPRASATPWTRLPSQSGPLPGANARYQRWIDSLASGTG